MIFGGYEMSNLFDTLKTRLSGNTKRIVLPESHDERILKAASQLQEEGLVEPVLVGKKDQVEQKASKLGINLDNVEVINPEDYPAFDEMVTRFVERRKGKATEEQVREMLLEENYIGNNLVKWIRAYVLVRYADDY